MNIPFPMDALRKFSDGETTAAASRTAEGLAVAMFEACKSKEDVERACLFLMVYGSQVLISWMITTIESEHATSVANGGKEHSPETRKELFKAIVSDVAGMLTEIGGDQIDAVHQGRAKSEMKTFTKEKKDPSGGETPKTSVVGDMFGKILRK